jgi:hypothetical protein
LEVTPPATTVSGAEAATIMRIRDSVPIRRSGAPATTGVEVGAAIGLGAVVFDMRILKARQGSMRAEPDSR